MSLCGNRITRELEDDALSMASLSSTSPLAFCCGEADAYEADSFEVSGDHYVAIITNGKGEIPEGRRIQVPNSKIKWDNGNPTGHGIIFIGSFGDVLCYVPPGGV